VVTITYFVNGSHLTIGSDGFSVNSKRCVDAIPRRFGVLLTSCLKPWMRHMSTLFFFFFFFKNQIYTA
jgi:hypothetical protein